MKRRATWRRIAPLIVAAIVIVVAATYVLYSRDLRTVKDRLAAGSRIVNTHHGSIEFAASGSGPAVLVVHGAGGGYDQGNLIVKAFGGEGFRWIVPSRFGYLRTPLPEDASTTAQAAAFAALLNALGIERTAILALSGGVPPALQFAQLYPSRTSALVLLSSAPYTPLTAGDQQLPIPIWLYQALFRSDFPYWLMQKLARGSLDEIFDVKPELRAKLTPPEAAFVEETIDAFQPVTLRVAGLGNEGAAIDPGVRYALDEIATPTLVVHARDDRINPFPIGEFTARHIPGAEFMPLPTGGHLLLGQQAQVRARVNAFLRDHADGPSGSEP